MTAPPVGRLVDCSQADDRRVIRLVRDRPLLYARNNIPVASFYSQVKKLWQEIADEMGWTVAQVRRKWSHVRNSYSRHLRNELGGARTGRGRAVSRWYLADELDFLREHMATDTRLSGFPSLVAQYGAGEAAGAAGGGWRGADEEADVKPLLCSYGAEAWRAVDVKPAAAAWRVPLPAGAVETALEPAPAPAPDDAHFAPEENSSYFQFFRGVYDDYRSLPARKQRLFRRECVALLHRLLDEEDASPAPSPRPAPSPPASPASPPPHEHSILPND